MEEPLWENNSVTNSTYNSTTDFDISSDISQAYIIISSVLVLLCVFAVVVNARTLISVRWIRRPLSPTLHISLSLALADVLVAFFLALNLIINSLIEEGLGYKFVNNCGTLTLEACRLSAILITTTHLLALAGNHYLGIVCPFRSIRWMTHTNINALTAFIWITPTLYIFIYFASIEGQGYRASCNSSATYLFIFKKQFRQIFSAYFFVALAIMFVIYFHISIIVRRHQANRRWYNRHSRRYNVGVSNSNNEQQHLFKRNLKAIWTTLLILSTYLICFMPSVLMFALACQDCYINLEKEEARTRLIIGSFFHFLLITKPLLNPLIYTSRMHEIRVATRRMNAACRMVCCPFLSRDELNRSNSCTTDGTNLQLVSYESGSTRRHHCSINSTHVGNGFATRSCRRTEEVTADL